MKTKKTEKDKISEMIFGYAKIFMILTILIGLAIYCCSLVDDIKFNPTIHTCDEWCKCLCDCSSTSISYNEKIDNCCSMDSFGIWEQQICTSWHDTTFCERCQEIPLEEWYHRLIYDNQKWIKHYKTCHDHCICDEKIETLYSGYIIFCAQKTCYQKNFFDINKTELDKYKKIPTDNEFTALINNKTTSFEIDYFISTYSECLSARKKTECEKDNPDYILRNNSHWVLTYNCNCRDLIYDVELQNICACLLFPYPK